MYSYEGYAKIRDSKKLKDSDIARIADIPQSTFSDWKKGKSYPKTQKLKKIADALECDMSTLLMEKHKARESTTEGTTLHDDRMAPPLKVDDWNGT